MKPKGDIKELSHIKSMFCMAFLCLYGSLSEPRKSQKIPLKRDTLFLFIYLIFRYTEKGTVFTRITYFYYVSKTGTISPYLMRIIHHNFDAFFRSNGVRFRLSNPDAVRPFHKALRLKVDAQ